VFNDGFEHLLQIVIELEHASLQMEFHTHCQHCVFHRACGHDVEGLSVGRDSAGSFSIRGDHYSTDGDIAISSSKEVVKRCVGRKPWMLLFALRAWQKRKKLYMVRQAIPGTVRIFIEVWCRSISCG
jgi:hypothetical protein